MAVGIRTQDLRFRRPLLYPTELLPHFWKAAFIDNLQPAEKIFLKKTELILLHVEFFLQIHEGQKLCIGWRGSLNGKFFVHVLRELIEGNE